MTHVVLFHPAEHGHTVETPGYHDGEVFEDLDAGLSRRDLRRYTGF
ncbi:hypothetical protein [Amycolatopsis minnesotensis]|uniref:Uncharacterized protein n=1 Tax=Amycolatopsis minnesotensis TaxID=337894 RepID=A0ABN2RKI2_9PSEU